MRIAACAFFLLAVAAAQPLGDAPTAAPIEPIDKAPPGDPGGEVTTKSNFVVDSVIANIFHYFRSSLVPFEASPGKLHSSQYGMDVEADVRAVRIDGLDSLSRGGDAYLSTLDYCEQTNYITAHLSLHNISARADVGIASSFYYTDTAVLVTAKKISFIINVTFSADNDLSGCAKLVVVEDYHTDVENAPLIEGLIAEYSRTVPSKAIAHLNKILKCSTKDF